MPHILVSTQVRLESGPCTVGDEESDPELMRYLGAKLIKQLGNNYMEYRTDSVPRIVIDRLERRGYSVVSMTGVGQTCIWTMHRPYSLEEQRFVNEESERREKCANKEAGHSEINGQPMEEAAESK